MIKRRGFNYLFVGALISGVPSLVRATAIRPGDLFHASVGPRLFTYRVDSGCERILQIVEPSSAPEEIQYAAAHPSRDILYVASSNQNTGGGNRHFLSAFVVGPDGAPTPHGEPVALAARPIHLTVDQTGSYVLVAYNRPSNVSVHRVAEDGGIGEMISQPPGLNTGVYPHQIRMMPSNAAVIVPARGNDSRSSADEDPGALCIFAFEDGRLSNAQAIAPAGGLDFRPRHLDFAPSGNWAYIALESQNVVQAYRVTGNHLSDGPIYSTSTLMSGSPVQPGQRASAIRVHRNGRHLYVANRGTASETLPDGSRLNIGENTIAVFSVDQATGEPHLIQLAEIGGAHARTMDISANGEWMVAGSIRPALIREGDGLKNVAAGLTQFRILPDGRLQFTHKHDIDTGDDALFWVGAWRQGSALRLNFLGSD